MLIKAQMPFAPPMPMGGDSEQTSFGDPGPVPKKVPSAIIPLEGVGEILTDFGIMEYIATHVDVDEDIASKVWVTYGGNSDGSDNKNKIGRRVLRENVSPQEIEEEMKKTENKRWERLPKGSSIGDITSMPELAGLMKGFKFSLLKQMHSAQQPQEGGMGGLL